MIEENTSWCQSVAAVVIRNGKVLLARHTYGPGKGKLIIPGGYIKKNESPQEAVKREYLEEVNITIEPKEIIGIRFNSRDWYVVFSADYVSGKAESDHDENDEVVWLEIDKAMERDDVPGLSKQMIECALKKENGLVQMEYDGRHQPCSLYGVKGI